MVAHQRFGALCAESYLFLVSCTELEHNPLIPGPNKPPRMVDSIKTTNTRVIQKVSSDGLLRKNNNILQTMYIAI
jgi:hypothetical protein